MSFVYRHLLLGIFSFALFNQGAQAQVKLPDTSGRSPNLSLDPFESLRVKSATKTSVTSESNPRTQSSGTTATKQIPNSELEPPSIEPNAEKPATIESSADQDTTEPIKAEPIAPDKSPPYSYSLFLDVDYVNKFSGGANADSTASDSMGMSQGPEGEPSPSAIVGLLHFYGEYDTAKANLWRDGTFVIHMIYAAGDSPTTTVGDLRSVSNIDATFMDEEGNMIMPTLDLLELWYEHAFPFSKSSVRFGVGYLSSDFYKSKYTGLFLTSGISSIGTEILWNTMVSNPPTTTVGLWYKTKLTENIYGQAVVFDGVPDHTTKFFDVEFDEDDGIFLAAETGWLQGKPKEVGYLKLGGGYWYLSQNIKKNSMIGVSEFPGDPIAVRGFYTVIDKAIDNNIGTFFKGGIAFGAINKYRRYFTTGVTYKGIIPSRPQDTAGIAIVQSKLSDTYIKYRGLDANGDIATYSEETIYEITYSIPINKWLMIQPDIQYVLQPGMNIMNKNALVGILRAEFTIF